MSYSTALGDHDTFLEVFLRPVPTNHTALGDQDAFLEVFLGMRSAAQTEQGSCLNLSRFRDTCYDIGAIK